MFGRAKKDNDDAVAEAARIFGAALNESKSKNIKSSRTSSYPLDQNGAAPIQGAPKTTSYKAPMQYNARGYETIN